MSKYEIDELKKYAKIHCDPYDKKFPNQQPIMIGKTIVCDGFPTDVSSTGKTTAVFSHFHSDHINNINRAMTNCDHIIMTEATKDALVGTNVITERATLKILSPGKSFVTDQREKIELIDANHIPGSSQILTTMEENDLKILYSGDFCYPGITVPKANVLVLEAEHGEAIFDFETDRAFVYNQIFSKTFENLSKDIPVEIRAHPGTMQEIMSHLEKSVDGNQLDEDIQFFADKKSANLTSSLNYYYENKIREIKTATPEILNDLFENKEPYVRFAPIGVNTLQEERGIVIQADANVGFKKYGSFFTHDDHRYYACTASHSSYSDVLKYVHNVGPELVIVDGTRASSQTAKELAISISEKENILAIPHICDYES